MSAEEGLIKKANLTNAQIRETEFTLMFEDGIKKLIEVLGITRKIKKTAGTALARYKAVGTLSTTQPDEGDVIPLSEYSIAKVPYGELSLKKYRKATTIDAIEKYGFNQAVTMTSDKMISQVQGTIRTGFFTSLEVSGTTPTTGANFQQALANAWGKLQILFEDTSATPVYIVNPMDIAGYLGNASITTQNAFGMTYIKDFLGLGTVIAISNVPQGTVYATARENLVLYYVAANEGDIDEAFDFTTDETGYIGIHESADYTRLNAETVVICGVSFFAERIDGIVKATISNTLSD